VIEAALALIFGLLIGSFLNVCIHRWPRDLSVVRPRSHCPACGKTIAWYDNIPVLSFLVLRGRCRHCAARISVRYPVVELGTGLLFFWFVYRYGPTLEALKLCVFSAMLVALIFSDLEERILPDEFTLGGTVAGLVLAAFVPLDAEFISLLLPFRLGPRGHSLEESAFGALIGSGAIWFVGFIYEKLRHREGLGLGDVKMIAMIGAFLGLRLALLTLMLASLLGAVVGLVYIVATRKDSSTYELPFGSFLGLAALIVGLFGQVIVVWYSHLGA
jgi:leader peptidase (prepilin peptidase) / N-methyltransferase